MAITMRMVARILFLTHQSHVAQSGVSLKIQPKCPQVVEVPAWVISQVIVCVGCTCSHKNQVQCKDIGHRKINSRLSHINKNFDTSTECALTSTLTYHNKLKFPIWENEKTASYLFSGFLLREPNCAVRTVFTLRFVVSVSTARKFRLVARSCAL
jgi:hypothetical protein